LGHTDGAGVTHATFLFGLAHAAEYRGRVSVCKGSSPLKL
jgi:hypothetical protein